MTIEERGNIQTETIMSWWQSVRQSTQAFEAYFRYAPQTIVDKGIAGDTIQCLMQTYQNVQRIPYPQEAESAQRHLVNALLHLRLSIEEAVRQHPERSHRYYAQAHNQLRRLHNCLKAYAINDVVV